ncbi:MAG: hypothetical protein ACE5NA_12645 [Nitrospiraceae bacterium]
MSRLPDMSMEHLLEESFLDRLSVKEDHAALVGKANSARQTPAETVA